MHRTAVQRRLSDVHARLVRARDELAVLDEQLAVVSEMADDTRIKALVSETPLSARDHDEVTRHVRAMQRSHDELVASIAELERRQDELLAELVAEPG